MQTIKFRAWDKFSKTWLDKDELFISVLNGELSGWQKECDWELMQFTGLLDKNGKEIYEGDIVGQESVYHFLERDGWEPSSGNWKIISEKSKNFTGKGKEKYVAGYQLRIVEWKESSCGFEPFSDSDENCGHCGGGVRPSDYEVIGNIYENPELLEKDNKRE